MSMLAGDVLSANPQVAVPLSKPLLRANTVDAARLYKAPAVADPVPPVETWLLRSAKPSTFPTALTAAALLYVPDDGPLDNTWNIFPESSMLLSELPSSTHAQFPSSSK